MRVGLLYERTATNGDLTPILEQIVEVDRLGFDSVWITDRHFDRQGIGSVPIVLAALAKRTRAIRLGTFKILALDHPARVAEDFAMIDLLSGGRLSFGAALGDREQEFRRYHVPFGERAARFREALDLILAAWSFDEIAYGGRYYQFPAHTAPGSGLQRRRPRTGYVPQWERGPELPDVLSVTPKPRQQPRPPVWILAEDAELLRFAAARGHSAVLPTADVPALAAAAEAYDAALARAGRDRSEVELAIIVDLPLDGDHVRGGTLEQLHRLQDDTGANQFIWRIDATVPHQALLAAARHFAAEIQPLLQA